MGKGKHVDHPKGGAHDTHEPKDCCSVRLMLDPSNGRLIERSHAFVTPVASAVTPDPDIVAMLDSYRSQIAPLKSIVIGQSTVFIPRADACGQNAGRTCESKIGNAVTDAMRETYSTDFAITNSGGIRADLTCPVLDSATDFCPPFTGPNFDITIGQVQTVLPFGNVVVRLTVSGAELKSMLENGLSIMPGADGRFPQVSGLCFTYDISSPVGSRVTGAVRQASDGTCTGAPLDLTAASSYTIAENDFMALGGDEYPSFTGRYTTLERMDDVVIDYIGHETPITPAIQGRIQCTTSGATACPVVTP
jgi:2',3'-cyclic-nucleotide 2'-phosphodiesterase (5'-nucleotidase family)